MSQYITKTLQLSLTQEEWDELTKRADQADYTEEQYLEDLIQRLSN